ncbi:MAG: C25 family cysteine peptidase [Thermodesulfobacteriota bacterium]|nr:C25 family cysteine peptidase [Thermodesulfobacteriota bacterium]
MKSKATVCFSLFLLIIVTPCFVFQKQPASGLALAASRDPGDVGYEYLEGEEEQRCPNYSHVEVLDSTAESVMLRFSLGEMDIGSMEMADGNQYHTIMDPSPEAGTFEVGKPAVPVFGYWILIPNGTEPELVIDPGGCAIIDAIHLKPVQPSAYALDDENIIPPFTKDEEAYAADRRYPGVLAELGPTEIVRGQQCALLWIYPYQYNPTQERTYAYHSLAIAIHFHGHIMPKPDNFFDPLFRRVSLNGDAVISAEDEAKGLLEPPPHEVYPKGSYGWDYIIVTHPDFKAAAQDMAAWKKQCGFKTAIYMKHHLKAQDIKNVLKDGFDRWDIKPKYVLIIGDAEYVPTNYKTEHGMNKGKIGTDLYYTTLNTGPSLDQTDYQPDIYIGRISVDTDGQAKRRVKAIINYEETPTMNSHFYNNVALCTYFQDGGNYSMDGVKKYFQPNGVEDGMFCRTTEKLAVYLSDGKHKIKKSVNRIYYTENNVTPAKWGFSESPSSTQGTPIPAYLQRPHFGWSGYHVDITNAVTSGAFLVTHFDHGGRQEWVHPAYEWSDAYLLFNFSLLPVVWSANCQTGWFDNETDDPKANTKASEECFSEYWERPAYSVYGDCGAVGIIAGTRITWNEYNSYLLQGWTDAIWPGLLPTSSPADLRVLEMGPVLCAGKFYMATKVKEETKYTGASKTTTEKIRKHYEMYHWFGDPSMEIRTEKPKYVYAQIPQVLSLSDYLKQFTVNVHFINEHHEHLGPASGAKVTISKIDAPLDDYSNYFVGVTDEEGAVHFNEAAMSTPGQYTVTITASNGVPFQDLLTMEE